MSDQVLIDIGKAVFLIVVYILDTGLCGVIWAHGKDDFKEGLPWVMYAIGGVLYTTTILALWNLKGDSTMLKGKYLKIKDLHPVYETNFAEYYGPVLYDNFNLTGVNVTVDVDEKFVKQHGPIMARPTTLPCKAYQVLDIEECTRNIQDEVFEAIRKLRSGIDYNERKLYFKGLSSNALIDNYTGSEFMAMYEKYQEGTQKEHGELQKKIEEAKKLLKENGYILGIKEEV